MIHRHSWLSILAAALLAAAPARAAPRQLAVLVGRSLASIEAAVRGIRAIPGVETRVFRLDEGTKEIDRAVASLKRYPFDGVVALGASAHEFFRQTGSRLPYAATLVLGKGNGGDADVVPFEAAPKEWVAVLDHLFPKAKAVGTVATGGTEAARLEPFSKALAAGQRSLEVQRSGGSGALSVALRRLFTKVQVFYFPRDRGLLQPTVAREVLKAAHRKQVPVLAFSRGLVKVGALLSLDLTPELAGERAARRVLRLPEGHIRAVLTLNRARARSLGLTIPEALEKRAAHP